MIREMFFQFPGQTCCTAKDRIYQREEITVIYTSAHIVVVQQSIHNTSYKYLQIKNHVWNHKTKRYITPFAENHPFGQTNHETSCFASSKWALRPHQLCTLILSRYFRRCNRVASTVAIFCSVCLADFMILGPTLLPYDRMTGWIFNGLNALIKTDKNMLHQEKSRKDLTRTSNKNHPTKPGLFKQIWQFCTFFLFCFLLRPKQTSEWSISSDDPPTSSGTWNLKLGISNLPSGLSHWNQHGEGSKYGIRKRLGCILGCYAPPRPTMSKWFISGAPSGRKWSFLQNCCHPGVNYRSRSHGKSTSLRWSYHWTRAFSNHVRLPSPNILGT